MSGKPTAVELWGTAEAARALGVSRETLLRWSNTDRFPQPIARLTMGRVYLAAEIRDWHRREMQRRREARAF